MYIDKSKLREFLEERINWLSYSDDAETKESLDYYNRVLESLLSENKLVSYVASIAIGDSEYAEALHTMLINGEFDLIQEKERE